MNPNYNQNYTKEQIELILNQIKECVLNGHFTVSLNRQRQENIDFVNEYNIRHNRQVAIIQQIQCDDFCHSLQNINPGFEHEVLYVFAPQVDLYNATGDKELVDVYTKFNLIKRSDSNFTFVVSFHKLNRPISYLFR